MTDNHSGPDLYVGTLAEGTQLTEQQAILESLKEVEQHFTDDPQDAVKVGCLLGGWSPGDTTATIEVAFVALPQRVHENPNQELWPFALLLLMATRGVHTPYIHPEDAASMVAELGDPAKSLGWVIVENQCGNGQPDQPMRRLTFCSSERYLVTLERMPNGELRPPQVSEDLDQGVVAHAAATLTYMSLLLGIRHGSVTSDSS